MTLNWLRRNSGIRIPPSRVIDDPWLLQPSVSHLDLLKRLHDYKEQATARTKLQRMARNESGMRTESNQTIVKKACVHLTIKFQIDKFGPMMNSAAPGEDHWSEGVSSELAPRAAWKLRVYPNGESEENRGCTSVFLHLTGPMKEEKKSLEASYDLYFHGGPTGTTYYSLQHARDYFGNEYYGRGAHASHDRVRKALKADGSLEVEAHVSIEINNHFIRNTLGVENVVGMAVFADTHSLENVKEACVELIASKGKAVYESAAWKELRESMPQFALDLTEGASVVPAERR